MYLDTLKVSTLEQTADQTSARGGKGNPELITWDYGKEISLSLEDALYTPASQSLMWGGKFGIKKPKVQGLWNPLVYPKDTYGRTTYIQKEVIEVVPDSTPIEQGTEGTLTVDGTQYRVVYDNYKWQPANGSTQEQIDFINSLIQFVCPCDGEAKFVRFAPVKASFKYEEIDNFGTGYKCPKGYQTGEAENSEAQTAQLVKTYYWNVGTETIFSGLTEAKQDHPDEYRGRPERAELAIDNYGSFNFTTYNMNVKTGTLADGIITLDDTASDNFCIYTPVNQCDTIDGDSAELCGSAAEAYGYEWNNVDMKMTSLEGDQDIYYLENVNLRYRIPRNSAEKEIMVARQGLYETEYDANETPKWVNVSDEEIIDQIVNLTRQNTSDQSYGYTIQPYDSTIQFFMNIKINIPMADDSMDYYVRVPLGTFYIVSDWNFGGSTAYDMIYPIDGGIENVSVLDRMEKCKATQTFAIDANKNLTMSNYRYMQEYAEAPLTVYIDPKTMKPFEANASQFIRQNGSIITGNLHIVKQHEIYYKWTRTIAPEYTTLGQRIIVDAEHFPGVFRIVGETYARSRDDGKDQRYQFEIPLAKLSAETNLTLQADGDPTTFTMNFKVMRRDDGVMMKLTQYDVSCNSYDGYTSGSTKVVPKDIIDNTYDKMSEISADVVLLEPQTREINITSPNYSQNIRAGLQINNTTETFDMNTLNTVDVNESSVITPLDSEDFTTEVSVNNGEEVESE